jgi:hypothetical protein
MDKIDEIVSILELAIQGATAGDKAPADQEPGDDEALAEADCFWDKHKRELFWEARLLRAADRWRFQGIAGLRSALGPLLLGQMKSVGEASVEHIEGDLRAKDSPVLTYYLYNMHPLFVDGVLSGELTRKLYKMGTEGHQMRAVVSKYHDLDNYPGIYLNAFCRREYPTGGNTQQVSASPWAGFGLTPEEYGHVCERIRLYLGDGKASLDYAKEVDMLHNPMQDRDRALSTTNPVGIDYPSGRRRYTKGERAPEIILEWVRAIEDNVFSLWHNYGHGDIPLPRCIMEVGWGKECRRRAAQHLTHEATNALFGVVTAIADLEYPGEFCIKQFQMVRLKDGEDVAAMEVYCSMIASSYWFAGGANPYGAGSVKQTGKGSVLAKGTEVAYARNADVNERSGPFDACDRVDREKQDRLSALLTEWERLPEMREKALKLEREAGEELEAMKKAQANLRLEEALAPLREAYQAFRESRLSAGANAPPALQLSLLSGPPRGADIEIPNSDE